MDPDTVWNDLRSALLANDLETAQDCAATLVSWLDGGGFPPRDMDSVDMEDTEVCFAVRRTCLAVLHRQSTGGTP